MNLLPDAIHTYEITGYQEIGRPDSVVHSTMNKFNLKEICLVQSAKKKALTISPADIGKNPDVRRCFSFPGNNLGVAVYQGIACGVSFGK